jgi:vitamin B12 transporter
MHSSSLKSRLLSIAVGLAGVPLLFSPALAQQPIALPPIVVQGATLEAPQRPVASAPVQSPGPAPAATGEGPDAAQAAGQGAASESSIAGVPDYTVGNAVTVVTGEELRAQQVRHAGEALRSLPGVSVSRSGGFGNLTQVRIRGAEGNHTLVLIDGIEANNTADGEFDFSNLSADDIERIEVIRGPMSGLYGSNAVGGVINIITRRGQGSLSMTVRAEAGSLGTRDVAARVAAGSDKAHIAVSYHTRDTDGFNIAPVGDERDGSRIGTFAARGGATLLPGLSLDFTVRHTEKVSDRDGFGGPAGTLATAIDDASTLHHRVLLAGSNLRWEMLGGRLVHELRANRNTTVTADTDRSAFSSFSRNISETDKLAYLASYRLDAPAIAVTSSFTGRVEKEAERFTPEGSFADGLERQRGRMAYTGEWRGGFADRLFLTAGIRRDDNDNFQDFTTWRAAASLVLSELHLRPHASVGTAVKLPTMFEQFGTSPFFVPNPALTPEESFGWDAGVELNVFKGLAILDVTYFRANLTDKINGTAPGPRPGTFTSVNLPGESTREGVEVAARVKLTRDLTLGGAYTYVDARTPTGEREFRRPPHAGRADLAYVFSGGRGTATLGAVYNGSQDDIAFQMPFFFPTQRVTLDHYWLVNATVSYKLHPGVEVFGRVENALDQHYQEVFGFESGPLAAYAGLKLTFGGTEGIGTAWAK